MEQERINALAQEALELHTDPRSHMMFRLDIAKAIKQVVDEQDTLDIDTLGACLAYRNHLISEVTSAVEILQQD